MANAVIATLKFDGADFSLSSGGAFNWRLAHPNPVDG